MPLLEASEASLEPVEIANINILSDNGYTFYRIRKTLSVNFCALHMPLSSLDGSRQHT